MSTVRQLTIKTNVVKRILSDVRIIRLDIEDAKKRVEKRVQDGDEEAAIEHQKVVLKHHERALPDAFQRLSKAVDDLQLFMKDPAFEDTPELSAAQEMLQKARETLNTQDA
ncbi:tubulin specific chaperone cofactor A [Schizosaccharomyces japonicus yFS275]|uniref:Tubulin-specific chaperone A n=1 Tax=Schizosaccharomyces japonicus (strain yFS275 / FY16936) TaxID=402676 RepID=B6K206_SCHJY|nr:tubulin specific chaperone cofactor A [Schizosaccharomyces japonicus yFS275]EEB07187.1 tubulin specific chaperone cofactor A [Schizosaccharomyces japonicus yFS275]